MSKEAAKTILAAVDITGTDIERGMHGSHRFCPIALALRGMWADVTDVSVGPNSAGATINNERYTCHLPGVAREFVDKFDRGQYVEPFSFGILLEKTFA